VNDLIPATADKAEIARADALLVKINELFQKVPEPQGDGLLNILEQILAVENAEELDRPWNSSGFEDYLGYAVRISNPRRRESKIKGGLSHYLIVDAVIKASGEAKTLITSSVAIVGQILVANGHGMLPMDFVPMEKETPTENGYYPQHLKVWHPHMPLVPEGGPRRRQEPAWGTGDGQTAKAMRERIQAQREASAPKPGFDLPDTPEF
jgi:hypothetical protein